jgi:hypothetical protein
MAKKLINQPTAVVRESLEGAVLTQPGTALLGDRLGRRHVVGDASEIGDEWAPPSPVAAQHIGQDQRGG